MPLPEFELKNLKPIAQGSSRWVFQHPENPDLLIKVLKHRLPDQQVYGLKKRLKALKGKHKLTRHLREIEQFLAVKSRPSDRFIQHLPEMPGFVSTDMGIGFLVEAIKGQDGKLAPTLKQLIKTSQLTIQRITLLELFFKRLLESDVVAGDAHAGNLVLGTNSNGEEFFALVDGLGDSTVIPTRALSWLINRYKKYQGIQKLRATYEKQLKPNQLKQILPIQSNFSIFFPDK